MTTPDEGLTRHLPINRWWRRLAMVIALLVGVTLAWRYRPLSGTERRLIGEWIVRDDGIVRVIWFDPSRRYLILTGSEGVGILMDGAVERGNWSATRGRVSFSRDESQWSSWDDFVRYVRNFADGERATKTLPIEFDTDDRLRVLRTVRPGVMQLESWDRSSEAARPAAVRDLDEKVE